MRDHLAIYTSPTTVDPPLPNLQANWPSSFIVAIIVAIVVSVLKRGVVAGDVEGNVDVTNAAVNAANNRGLNDGRSGSGNWVRDGNGSGGGGGRGGGGGNNGIRLDSGSFLTTENIINMKSRTREPSIVRPQRNTLEPGPDLQEPTIRLRIKTLQGISESSIITKRKIHPETLRNDIGVEQIQIFILNNLMKAREPLEDLPGPVDVFRAVAEVGVVEHAAMGAVGVEEEAPLDNVSRDREGESVGCGG